MNVRIEPLAETQLAAVIGLLNEAGLPSQDVHEHRQNFLVALNGAELVGAVGLEIYDAGALVRSLVVKPSLRNQGVGKLLYDAAVVFAKKHRVSQLGLLTNTAERFFAREGFVKIEKDQTPEFIKRTKEYTTFCPSSAVVMAKWIP